MGTPGLTYHPPLPVDSRPIPHAQSPDGLSFVASTEDGVVKCFDVRKGAGSKAELWAIKAHAAAASALDFCPAAHEILATGGQDKLVKLWDVSGAEPAMVGKRNLQLGAIFDVRFSLDSPHLLAAGGSKGKLGMWNTLELESMQSRMPEAQAALGEDGRVLSGAVAGMGKLDVNSDTDEDEDSGRGRGFAAHRREDEREEEEEDDYDDDDDDDDDDEAEAQAAPASSSALAGGRAKKLKGKGKVKRRHR